MHRVIGNAALSEPSDKNKLGAVHSTLSPVRDVKHRRLWAAMKWVSPQMAHAPQLATCATCMRSRALCGRFNEGLRGAQR